MTCSVWQEVLHVCTPVFLNRVREKEKAGRKKEIQVNEQQQHYETVSGILIIIFLLMFIIIVIIITTAFNTNSSSSLLSFMWRFISVKVICLYMVGIMLSHVFNRGFPGFESCHGCIAVLFESQLKFNPVHDVHQNSYWAGNRSECCASFKSR